MGGCCGAMKTGQKSLPENKQQKVDTENKQTEKKEALTCANNATTEAVNDKTIKTNHNDTEAVKDGAKVANGLDDLTSNAVPETACANGGEGVVSVEEAVATKIVTQAMEAAIAETNGTGLEQQTSVTGSVGGVSDEEALNEWMKADTNNALVIDEPTLESSAQSEVLAAAVDVPVDAAAQPAVQPDNIEVTVHSDVIPEAVMSAESHTDIVEEPSKVEEPVKVQNVASSVEEVQVMAEDNFQSQPEPSEEAAVDTWATPEPSESVIATDSARAEPEVREFVENVDERQPIEEFSPQDAPVEFSQPVSNQANDVVAFHPESAPLEVSEAASTNLPSVGDNTEFPPEHLTETLVSNSSDNALISDPQLVESQENIPIVEILHAEKGVGDEFDSEALPPPPPEELLEEPVVSSPDFPELPVLDPVPAPEDQPPAETSEELRINHSEPSDAASSGELAAQNDSSDVQQMSPEVPESVPVLEEVVEQASEQRNQWWNESGKEEEQLPYVNGTSDINGDQLVDSAVPHDQYSIPNSYDTEFNQDIATIPNKSTLQQEELVPSLESDLNHESNNKEAVVNAQA